MTKEENDLILFLLRYASREGDRIPRLTMVQSRLAEKILKDWERKPLPRDRKPTSRGFGLEG